MGKCMIGHTNRIDDAVLSGGAWVPSLPLANLKNRLLGKVARSSDLATNSTFLKIDLGVPRKVRLVDLRNHNLSLTGQFRVRATIEAPASNLLQYTEGVQGWGVAVSTPMAAPNFYAGLTGVTVRNDNTSGDSPYKQSTAMGLVAGTYAFSIFVDLSKSTSPTDLIYLSGLAFDAGAGAYSMARSTFDPVTKALAVDTSYRNGAHAGHFAEQIGGAASAVWRLTKVVTFASAIDNPRIHVYTSTHLSKITVGLPQIEVGNTATSYYPNLANAASAARPAGYMDSWQSYFYDSGLLDAWPVVYPYGTLEWEDDNFWSGRYADEERAGYTTGATHILAGDKVARYWRVDIADPLNTTGYVQLGRIFIGPAWQPTKNMSFGNSLGWETSTEVQQAFSGAEYFGVKTPYRVARLNLDHMTKDEGLVSAFEIIRRMGIDKELFFVRDSDDTVHALRTRFLGRLRQLNAIEFPYFNNSRLAFEIKESL